MRHLINLATLISIWWCMITKTQQIIIAIISAISLSGLLTHIHMILKNRYSCLIANVVMSVIWTTLFLAFGWILTKNLKSKIRSEEVNQKLSKANIELAESHRNLEESHQKLEEMQALLQELAIRDPLTGLYNRRSMIEELIRLRSYAQREVRNKRNVSIALIFMDLNNLKKINDQYDHQIGDSAICTAASIINAEVREGEDFLCRYGGDEYCAAIIFVDYSSPQQLVKQIAAFTYRVKKSVRKAPFFIGSQRVGLSITIGVHIMNLKEHDVMLELVKADQKMLQKKKRRDIGRNA